MAAKKIKMKGSDGKEYTVIENRRVRGVTDFEGTTGLSEPQYELEDGTRVIQEGFDNYRIAGTDVTLTEI